MLSAAVLLWNTISPTIFLRPFWTLILIFPILIFFLSSFLSLSSVVKFDTSEEAQRAIELFNGKVQADGPPMEVRFDRARK